MSPDTPDSLPVQLAAYISQERLLSATSRPLLAVSGGRDSMALLSLFLHLNKWPIAVAHFNFQLRGEESERDENYVTQICKRAALPLYVEREDAKAWCEAHKCSLEVGCRKLRYDFFERICEIHGYTEIVTAHHAEDQAETLLFHLSRGCGLKGLVGMRPRNGKIVRPLLALPRYALESWLSEQKLGYVEDSSNVTDDYTRNFIRHNVLPALAKVNKQTVRHLCSLSNHAQEAYETLRTEAEAIWGKIETPTNVLFDAHSPQVEAHRGLANFWLRERLLYLQFNENNVDTLLKLLADGQTGKKVLTDTWEAYIDRGKLVIVPRSTILPSIFYPDPSASDAYLRYTQEVIKQEFTQIELKKYANRGKAVALFDLDLINFPLVYRPWRAGDTMQPLGMPVVQKKKISDLLTDAHYPTHLRREARILVDAHEQILWLPRIRQSSYAALSPTTRRVLVVEVLDSIGE